MNLFRPALLSRLGLFSAQSRLYPAPASRESSLPRSDPLRLHQSVRQTSCWSLGHLNHVAIVVPDLCQAVAHYRDNLGAKVSEPEDLPDHGVTVVFIELGNTKLELLHPLNEKSPVAKFLEKNKAGGMHHICIEVDDIKAAVADVKAKGIRTLSPEPVIGAHGNPIVFLHPKDCNGVLTELEEVKSC